MRISFNKRCLWMIILGFSSGFPLLFSSTILKTWLVDQGGGLSQVGYISLLALPYSTCFIWAPIIDYVVGYRVLRRKNIIVFLLLGCASLLFGLARINPTDQFGRLMLFGGCLGLLGATQDHVIEAYRMMLLPQKERGLGVSWSFVGFRLALTAVGGLGLLVAGYYGWLFVYQSAMVVFFVLAMIMLYLPEEPVVPKTVSFGQHMLGCKRWISDVFSKRKRLIFLLTHRLSVFWLEAMLSVFLMFRLGFNEAEVGLVYMIYGMPGMVLGGIIMSQWIKRNPLPNLICRSIYIQLALYLVFTLFCLYPSISFLMVSFVFFEGCIQGLMSTLSAVWLMGEIDAESPTFGFSVWYGLSALGRVIVGPVAAYVISYCGGWISFSICGALIAFVSVRVAEKYFSHDLHSTTVLGAEQI